MTRSEEAWLRLDKLEVIHVSFFPPFSISHFVDNGDAGNVGSDGPLKVGFDMVRLWLLNQEKNQGGGVESLLNRLWAVCKFTYSSVGK